MIFIDIATKDDVLELLEIEQDAFSPPWSRDLLLSEICNEDSFFAVARLSDDLLRSVVGFVILRKMSDTGEILQIATYKDARRSGIADILMSSAFGFAKDNELGAVFLEVRESNTAAISLYKKHGASVVHRRESYYNDPIEDALIMRFSLKEFKLNQRACATRSPCGNRERCTK